MAVQKIKTLIIEKAMLFKSPCNHAGSPQNQQRLDWSVHAPIAGGSNRPADPAAGSGMDTPHDLMPVAAEAQSGRASARRPAHQLSASSDELLLEPPEG